jgi:hypothetical protein
LRLQKSLANSQCFCSGDSEIVRCLVGRQHPGFSIQPAKEVLLEKCFNIGLYMNGAKVTSEHLKICKPPVKRLRIINNSHKQFMQMPLVFAL